jgi:hypothetical protein
MSPVFGQKHQRTGFQYMIPALFWLAIYTHMYITKKVGSKFLKSAAFGDF